MPGDESEHSRRSIIKRTVAAAAVGLGGLTGTASAAEGQGRVVNPNEIPVDSVGIDRALTDSTTFYYTGMEPQIDDPGVEVVNAENIEAQDDGNPLLTAGNRTYIEWDGSGPKQSTFEITDSTGETWTLVWEEQVNESALPEFP